MEDEKIMNIREMVEHLENWGSLEGTELGKYWYALADAFHQLRPFASTDLANAISKEVIREYHASIENFEEKIEEITLPTQSYKILFPKNEE